MAEPRRKKTNYPSLPDLDARKAAPVSGEDLRLQIDMLRQVLERVREQIDDAQTLGELLRVLEGTSRASVRLATLLQAQKALAESNDTTSDLSRLLDNVLEAMREK